MKVAGWCEAHYIDLMPHNPLGPVSTAACIHLGAAVPNFAYLEDNFSEENMHSQWDTTVFPKLLMRESTMVRMLAISRVVFVWVLGNLFIALGICTGISTFVFLRPNNMFSFVAGNDRSATPRLGTLCRLSPALASKSMRRH